MFLAWVVSAYVSVPHVITGRTHELQTCLLLLFIYYRRFVFVILCVFSFVSMDLNFRMHASQLVKVVDRFLILSVTPTAVPLSWLSSAS